MKSLGPCDEAIMRVNRKGDGDMVVYTAFVPRTKLVKEVEVLNCQEAEGEAP